MAWLISLCLIHLPSQPSGKHWLNPRALQLFQFIPIYSCTLARCTHHLKLPAQADCMISRKENSKSETRASFPMTDVLGHMQHLWGIPTIHWPRGLEWETSCLSILALLFSHSALPKNRILNKDEIFLLLKSTCSSLEETSGSLVKDLLVFWPPVVWDIQKMCATSAGTFKWTHVAPGIAYIGLIKIYQPGKWELSYLEKQPTSSLLLRQCVPLSSFLSAHFLFCSDETLFSV